MEESQPRIVIDDTPIPELKEFRQPFKAILDAAQRCKVDGFYHKARALWESYLEAVPDDPAILFEVGSILGMKAINHAERILAAPYYQRCIESKWEENEIKSAAMSNMGVMMETIAGRPDKAIICYNLALQMHPENLAARTNFGDALRYEGKFEEADAEYELVLRMKPDDPGAHYCRGCIALLMGDYARGWDEYEWRFKVPTLPAKILDVEPPLWHGEDLAGKRILLWQEQGYGDTFMFIRYARELKKRWPSCHVIYYGSSEMMEVIACAEGVNEVRDCLEEEDFDYHVSVMSLPHRFGTVKETIPAELPYIYVPPRMDRTVGLLIGFAWAGSPRHGRDKERSLSPEDFKPIIESKMATWVSLQIGPRAHEASAFSEYVIQDASLYCDSWLKTAQEIAMMDLIISCDTGIAHLAGAIGKPVWLLVPYGPDWRWGMGGTKTAWYPHHRLYRQPERGDWKTPIQQIIHDLQNDTL